MITIGSRSISKWVALVFCVALPLAVGFVSSLLAGDIRNVYEGMAKIPLSPPGWLFGVVWPALYILMGISSYLVLLSSQAAASTRRSATGLYLAQLFFNFIWSILFFRADSLWPAFGVIVILDVLVLACIYLFKPLSKPAAWLLAPYMLWILFATYLNVGFAVAN